MTEFPLPRRTAPHAPVGKSRESMQRSGGWGQSDMWARTTILVLLVRWRTSTHFTIPHSMAPRTLTHTILADMANITDTTASTTTTPRDLIPRPSADSLHQHHKHCMHITLVHAVRHASVQSHKPDCHKMDSVCPLQTPVCLDLPPSPLSSHVPAAQGRGSAEGWFIE
jgi:hypothetical protein